ncbi:hypothetical protein SAMN05428952_10376 [Nitrosomonas sp. Nm132]|nr:hypothetical protein SAMN05428952_10376 [Nitrosomonas sp. Nm132]
MSDHLYSRMIYNPKEHQIPQIRFNIQFLEILDDLVTSMYGINPPLRILIVFLLLSIDLILNKSIA